MGSTLTDSQAMALVGGVFGGFIVTILIGILVYYVITVIALWKIFAKAGEAGWKALIPIYNTYILCKITGINFWLYIIALPIVVGIVGGIIFKNDQNSINTLTSIYALFISIYSSIKLGKSFGKGTGFIVGLVLLPSIFELILGFGSSEYVGIPEK